MWLQMISWRLILASVCLFKSLRHSKKFPKYFVVRCRVRDKFLCLPAADVDCAGGGGGDEEKRSLMEQRSWAWWTRMGRARRYPQTWQSLSTSTPYKSRTSVGVLSYTSGDRGLVFSTWQLLSFVSRWWQSAFSPWETHVWTEPKLD